MRLLAQHSVNQINQGTVLRLSRQSENRPLIDPEEPKTLPAEENATQKAEREPAQPAVAAADATVPSPKKKKAFLWLIPAAAAILAAVLLAVTLSGKNSGTPAGPVNRHTVAAGSWHTVGLRADGTVVAVGDNHYGQCDVSDWRKIKLPENMAFVAK